MYSKYMKNRVISFLPLIGFLLSALSVLLLPFSGSHDEEKMSGIGIVLGIIFWIGIILGILLFLWIWSQVRRKESYKEVKKIKKPGYLSFASNKYALISDIIMGCSIIIVILSVIIISMPDLLILSGMFFMIFTLGTHFWLNGRVFYYLNNSKEGDRK